MRRNGVEVKEISTYSEMLKEKQVELKDLSISDILPDLILIQK